MGADPVRWFVPPYVGHRGWVGLRLDLPDTDWDEAAGALEDAHAFIVDRQALRRPGPRRGGGHPEP